MAETKTYVCMEVGRMKGMIANSPHQIEDTQRILFPYRRLKSNLRAILAYIQSILPSVAISASRDIIRTLPALRAYEDLTTFSPRFLTLASPTCSHPLSVGPRPCTSPLPTLNSSSCRVRVLYCYQSGALELTKKICMHQKHLTRSA